MEIREIKEKKEWESFVLAHPYQTFLQSWNFGEIYAEESHDIKRMGMFDGSTVSGACLVVKIKAKRGTFAFIPYGPLLSVDKPEYWKLWITEVKKIALAWNASFIRLCPILSLTKEHQDLFASLGFREAPIHMLTENFWKLDITKTPEEILAGMRKTTRNLIRRAEKDGVSVISGTSPELLETFLSLHQQTVSRHHFVPYPVSFFKKQVEIFAKDDQVKIFVASHEGKPISSAIVMYYGNQASYHHGASVASKIPASYLLQWEAIKEAKKRGIPWYNFWGVVQDQPKHPWSGLSFFKMGFGGSLSEMVGGQDYPLSFWYYVNYLIEWLRKKKRGF